MRRHVHTFVWLAALVYGLTLVVGSLDGFPITSPSGTRMPFLSDKPIGEDGYYMLTIAWRMGGGEGFTYNAGEPTTGIQPLSTLVFAAIAAVVRGAGGDRWTYARVMLAAGIAQWLLVAAALGSLTRAVAASMDKPHPVPAGALAALLTLLSYSVFRISTYALETAIYLLLFAACIGLSLRGLRNLRDALLFGVTAGVTILARIDFLVILGLFLLTEMLRGRLPFRLAALTGVTAAIIASPWFAFVYSTTGHIMPTSGRAQSALPMDAGEVVVRLSHMLAAVAQHLSPWLYLPAADAALQRLVGAASLGPLVTLMTLATGAAVAWQAWKRLPSAPALPLASWLVALAALFSIYVVMFRPVFFYSRYSAPLLAIVTPLLAIGLLRLMAAARATTLVVPAMVIGFALTAWVTLHTGRVGNSHSMSAGFIASRLPAAVVGAYQSGAVGYFNENVINLDGKVNAGVLAAHQEGTFLEYVERRGITHVVDWPSVIGQAESPFSRWDDCGLGTFGYSICRSRAAR